MIKPIADTWTIIFILTVINILFFLLIKTYKRYFLGQTILFAFTLTIFIAWDIYVFPHYKDKVETERKNDVVKNGGETSHEVWVSTEKTEHFIYSINRPIFEVGGFQTILTFLFSLFGLWGTTEKKLFRTTSVIFGFLSGLFLVIYFIASHTPTQIG